jgi:hypothetical protein
MLRKIQAALTSTMLTLAAGCGDSSATKNAPPASHDNSPSSAPSTAEPQADPDASSAAGPALKPGGGLVAEDSGVKGTLAIKIRWSATIVTGIPAEGLTTSVYKRNAQLECPVTSSAESPSSYFAAFDKPNGDVFAVTGSYQPWFNEDCTGSLTIEDTYHADDPTIAGPEPVVKTAGTRPLKTSDIPLTVETDLNRARTRYLFMSPSADGFQQEAAPGYPAKLVAAAAAPMATMDFTLEGPIGGGKREVKVQGGTVWVDWMFTRERSK